jgi:hypothetical protein
VFVRGVVMVCSIVCSDDYYDELVYQNCAREMKRAYRRNQKVVICVVSFASEERN